MTFVHIPVFLGLLAAFAAGAEDPVGFSGLAGAPVKITTGKPEPAAADLRARLKDSLTLEAAIAIAAGNNRDIQAVLAEAEGAAAGRRSARMLPDLALEGDMRFGDGARRSDYALTVGLSDLLFYPVKWSAAGSAFRRDRMRAARELRGLIADVKAAYYRLAAQEAIRKLSLAALEGAEAADTLSARQLRAGNIGLLERSVQAEERQNAVLALSAVEADLAADRFDFARLLGLGGSDAPIALQEASLELPARDPSPEALLPALLGANPELAAAKENAAAAGSAATLAEWNRLPALRGGVVLEQEGSRSFLGPKLALDVPLDLGWNAAAKARADRAAAEHRMAGLQDRLAAELKTSQARMAAARKTIAYYREEVIPLREKVLAETQKQYNFMLIGVYQIIQAQQNEYLAQRGVLEAQRAYWLSHVELERMLGTPVPHPSEPSGGAR